MYEAARIEDTIRHSQALLGFLVGAVLGCLLIAAVAALTICTGGIGGFLLGMALGILANVGAHELLNLGEMIGGMFGTTTGDIVRGAVTVFTNGRNAATVTDEVGCNKHSPPQKIAQGSKTVFIEGLPASRKNDKTTCDAKIETASDNVFIGGGTETYLEITPEIPDAYRKYVEWAFTAAAFIGGLAGVLRGAGRGALRCALKYTAGFVAGEAVGEYVVNPAVSAVMGHPVNVTTGRKLLTNEAETDFSLPGPLPITSSRFYSSGLSNEGMIGRGWLHEWDISLRFTQDQVIYTAARGRAIPFPRIAPGQQVFLPAEQVTLAHVPDGRHIVYGQDEIYYLFGPPLPDGAARLIGIEDQVGRAIAFQRSANGRLETVAGGGHTLRLLYGAFNSVTRINLVEGGTPRTLISYEYDGNNRLTSVTDQSGRVVRRFSYEDNTTLMTGYTDALGFTCGYRWETIDGQPRVIEERTSEGEHYRITYDFKNRQTWVQDTFGNQAHWRYDGRTNVLENTWFDGRTSRFEYDENDNLTVMHLAGDRKVSLEYDDQSRIVALTDPIGRVTRKEYDGATLRIKRETLPDGAQWQAQYDHRGLLLSSKDALGRETQYEYGADALPDIIVDPNGGEKRLEWNKRGQITSYSDSAGKTTHYEYDPDGKMIEVIDAAGNRTAIQRSGVGTALQISRPDGSQVQLDYLPNGLMSGTRDGSGRVSRWEYNSRGQIVRSISPGKRSVTSRYDEHGRLLELRNLNGSSTRFSYDAGNRLTLEIGVDQIEKRFRYDVAGFLVAVETHGHDDAGNGVKREIAFERDPGGRMVTRRTETAVTTYEYDPVDRLLSAQMTPTETGKAIGIVSDTVKFEYDAAGRLIAEEGANGRLKYALDELGNLTSVTLPQGQQLGMLRTASGHVSQFRIGDQLVSDIERDDLHREIMRTQGRLRTTFTLDALGRRTWQNTNPAESVGRGARPTSTLELARIWRTYSYDMSGEMIELGDFQRGTQQFRYDEEGRLLSRSYRQGAEEFTWDDAGNLCPSEPLAGSLYGTMVVNNRLKVWQDIRLTYDAFGNIATKKKSRSQQHFEYDAEDRLVAVHGNSPRGRLTTRFNYDAVGRRIGKTVWDARQAGSLRAEVNPQGQETRFVWQGLRMLQEQSNGNLRSYLYDPISIAPIACLDQTVQENGSVSAGQLYYFHTDQIGTPLEVTDASGALAWSGHYTAWGKLRDDVLPHKLSTAFTQNLRYQGQYADESTGLHYNTFRYYDPDIARFTTQDPIGLNGGMNLYQYAPNPILWIDPWGWASGDYGQMPTIPGFQKHHNIPQNLQNHPAITESGFDVNSSRNITQLPTTGATDPARTVHRGMHADAYNEMVSGRLDEIHNMNASPEIKKMHVGALSDELGNDLRTKKIKLNNAC